jgi:hypothetical protein
VVAYLLQAGSRVDAGSPFEGDGWIDFAVENMDLGQVADAKNGSIEDYGIPDAQLAHDLFGQRCGQMIRGHLILLAESDQQSGKEFSSNFG